MSSNRFAHSKLDINRDVCLCSSGVHTHTRCGLFCHDHTRLSRVSSIVLVSHIVEPPPITLMRMQRLPLLTTAHGHIGQWCMHWPVVMLLMHYLLRWWDMACVRRHYLLSCVGVNAAAHPNVRCWCPAVTPLNHWLTPCGFAIACPTPRQRCQWRSRF